MKVFSHPLVPLSTLTEVSLAVLLSQNFFSKKSFNKVRPSSHRSTFYTLLFCGIKKKFSLVTSSRTGIAATEMGTNVLRTAAVRISRFLIFKSTKIVQILKVGTRRRHKCPPRSDLNLK